MYIYIYFFYHEIPQKDLKTYIILNLSLSQNCINGIHGKLQLKD